MSTVICVKSYSPPPVERREILRYAGAKDASPEITGIMEECLGEIEGKLACRVCFGEFPVKRHDGIIDLGFARTESSDLKKNLADCGRIVVFAATVGLELDRLIARYSRLSPVKALMFQAIGAERIEALCDVFSAEVSASAAREGLRTRPRFSPGYGDLPLAIQQDIFAALDCPKKIGLTLNESLLMSPSKSVTAIIGIGGQGADCPSGCAACGLKDCIFGEHYENN